MASFASDEDLFGLRGKVAIVLGAGQGIGRAAALRLAQAGASVAIVDIEPERAEAVAAEVRELGVQALVVRRNVLDPADCALAFSDTRDELGLATVFVSIVGQALMKPALEITVEEWDREHTRNLKYVFFAAQAFARLVIEAGEEGSIAIVGSVDGLRGAPIHAPYGAAKAGLSNLVQSLAVEWADHRIRVNCVAPGSISTPRLADGEAGRAIMHDSLVPMRRSGQPHEIANALLFLSSSLASYVTGHTLAADGGFIAANLFNLARNPESVRIKPQQLSG